RPRPGAPSLEAQRRSDYRRHGGQREIVLVLVLVVVLETRGTTEDDDEDEHDGRAADAPRLNDPTHGSARSPIARSAPPAAPRRHAAPPRRRLAARRHPLLAAAEAGHLDAASRLRRRRTHLRRWPGPRVDAAAPRPPGSPRREGELLPDWRKSKRASRNCTTDDRRRTHPGDAHPQPRQSPATPR